MLSQAFVGDNDNFCGSDITVGVLAGRPASSPWQMEMDVTIPASADNGEVLLDLVAAGGTLASLDLGPHQPSAVPGFVSLTVYDQVGGSAVNGLVAVTPGAAVNLLLLWDGVNLEAYVDGTLAVTLASAIFAPAVGPDVEVVVFGDHATSWPVTMVSFAQP